MTENQKLREALQAISHIDDTTNHSVDASTALDRIGQIARQALALPTADHLPEAGEMVVDHFPDATKMIETAVPVCERERLTLSAEDVHAAFVKHFPKTRISQAWIGFAAEIAEAIAARASLSDGDAVDAQRYRWLREQNDDDFAFAVVKNPHFDVYESPEELDAAIDAARAKGQS